MNLRHATADVDVTRVSGRAREPARDTLAGEEPMEIRLAIPQEDGVFTRSLSVTMRTPGDDFELAAGFLFTEGILTGPIDIERIAYAPGGTREEEGNVVTVSIRRGVQLDPKRLLRNFYVTSSCGVCGKASLDAVRVIAPNELRPGAPTITAGLVGALPERLRADQSLFARTGGLHAAGLFTPGGELLALQEDVGRHNAVDKLVGEQFLAGNVPLSQAVLQVSGRAGFEIVQKAVVAGIPILSAVGAPSSLAVDLAREFDMTLLGFVREGRFTVYSDVGRLAST